MVIQYVQSPIVSECVHPSVCSLCVHVFLCKFTGTYLHTVHILSYAADAGQETLPKLSG